MSDTPNLAARLPSGPTTDDQLLELFLEWAIDHGYELYPAQEEAILEIFADKHVVLNTPTGSGKSMVALAMHFRAFAKARRSVYTSPIKALVSEKFFDLCRHFGAENVGMLTGDASINAKADVICCTAEVLASLALSEGDAAGVHSAIQDEFHYYGDRERGMAWQLPLLTLTKTRFLLMSATLGDTSRIREDLAAFSGRAVALVKSTSRPVPLTFTYSEEPLLETLQELVEANKAPVYVVNFTQRECAELAQSLTSLNFCTKEEKKVIADELKTFRFDSPYGKDVARYVRHGLGIHHAGLLPKYRLLVEGLTQKGLLKVILGTDTLGVGINVPIRTVLFTKLCKYDGVKTRLLSVRDFKQIAGRAGRKGYDDTGYVVCQAPDHMIENKRLESKANGDPKKLRKIRRKSAPDRGYVHWDQETFERLGSSPSEPLRSRFKIEHGFVLSLIQRPEAGYRAVITLIHASHESDSKQARLRRSAKTKFRELLAAKVIELVPRARGRRGQDVQVSEDLQRDFSVYHSLSLFLLHTVGRLPPDDPEFPLQVLTLVEAILEDPRAVLYKQLDKIKGDKVGELKAEGMDYEARMEVLDKLTWPMPDAELVLTAFDEYARGHPWVYAGMIKPKSIARDMYERFATFGEYTRLYSLERSEGVLLRHLNQTYKTLVQTIPDSLKTDDIIDVIGYLRSTLARADDSLVRAWETMVLGAPSEKPDEPELVPMNLARHPKLLQARIRTEVHALVNALARRDFEDAAAGLRGDDWDTDAIKAALDPFYETYPKVVFDHEARNARYTTLTQEAPGLWSVTQVLCDPEGDNFWFAEGEVDLRADGNPEGPLLALRRIES